MGRAIIDEAFGDVALRGLLLTNELHRHIIAAAAFGAGDLERSLATFDALRKDFPGSFNSLCYGRTLIAMGQVADAIRHFEAECRPAPDDVHAGMQLATLRFWMDDAAGATEILSRFTQYYECERVEVEPRQRELDDAIAHHKVHPDATDDFYTPEFVNSSWWGYWRTMSLSRFRQPNAALEHNIKEAVSSRLKNSPGVTCFVDFGAFCGFTVHALAKEFPNIRFIGIDRPEVSRDLSARYFKSPNLEFVAGNLFDDIEQMQLGDNAVLFHSRTATFCYPDYLRQLYSKARAKGVRHIMFQEGNTFSRWHMKFFEWGKYPDITVTSRSKMLLHDYKRIFDEVGFEVISQTHVDPNGLLDDLSGYGSRHRLVHAILA